MPEQGTSQAEESGDAGIEKLNHDSEGHLTNVDTSNKGAEQGEEQDVSINTNNGDGEGETKWGDEVEESEGTDTDNQSDRRTPQDSIAIKEADPSGKEIEAESRQQITEKDTLQSQDYGIQTPEGEPPDEGKGVCNNSEALEGKEAEIDEVQSHMLIDLNKEVSSSSNYGSQQLMKTSVKENHVPAIREYNQIQVIPAEEHAAKIASARDAIGDSDFFLVARTDACATSAKYGLSEAISSANLYMEAGADACFVEAPRDDEELKEIGKQTNGLRVCNMLEGGVTPLHTPEELRAMGFHLIVHPLTTLYASARAMLDVLKTLKDQGTTSDHLDKMATFEEFNQLVNLESCMQGENDGLVRFVVVIMGIVYVVGSVYLSVIWHLASVITVLEDSYGVKAMLKSKDLLKGKMRIALIFFFKFNVSLGVLNFVFKKFVVHGNHHMHLGMLYRVGVGLLCLLLLFKLMLFGLVIQTIIYFVCKSYHHENIDKSALSDHLEVYLGEYEPLKSKDVQMEGYEV
ncbi:hypothetical protein K7X08_002387 [Anisodus acutangulus]|uniref:Uncharacterized protein n=1 Tax=Anisodus acutangulus TaxID=402998 RepID=A0A9Q1LP40_9SOLA|nr:hypothetical protein K7X08_002387 [Anisodus acutangulus]